MTDEMLMSLQPGTRVKGVGKYGGPYPDECGTFLSYNNLINKAVVEWDEFVDERHAADGTVTEGHGWWVPTNLLELAEQIDFGEFTPNLMLDSIMELLGG